MEEQETINPSNKSESLPTMPPPFSSVPFPYPVLKRCVTKLLPVTVSNSGGVVQQRKVLEVEDRAYEIDPAVGGLNTDTIYGKVIKAIVLERRPENNGAYSRTSTVVAIKSSSKANMLREMRKRVENPFSEITAMQLIKEKGLSMAILLEALEDQHNIYVVMRHCEGAELFHYVFSESHNDAYKQFDEVFARNVFRQIIHQVGELHSLGWAHKDMSLENVLYDPDTGTATIIDFGMTVRHHMFAPATAENPVSVFSPTLPGEPLCGKKRYIAPEMLLTQHLPSLDFRRCDIWSCGVMLFMLLFSIFPWSNNTGEEDLATSINARFTWIAVQGNLTKVLDHWGWSDHLSAEVVGLLQSMLRADPSQRPTAAEILQHPWLQQQATTTTAAAGAE